MDQASNTSDTLAITSFTIVEDGTAPTLAEVTPVETPTEDTTPNYTFSSTEVGDIAYGGDCSSTTTRASVGDNTITFDALATGEYSNCTITVTDDAENASDPLSVTTFEVVDNTAPTLTEVTPVTTPTTDTTPNYTFSSNEAGTISYDGSCESSTTVATTGNNTITLNELTPGLSSS